MNNYEHVMIFCYEIYDNGKAVFWGNVTLSYNDSDADTVAEKLREHAAKVNNCEHNQVRIVSGIKVK